MANSRNQASSQLASVANSALSEQFIPTNYWFNSRHGYAATVWPSSTSSPSLQSVCSKDVLRGIFLPSFQPNCSMWKNDFLVQYTIWQDHSLTKWHNEPHTKMLNRTIYCIVNKEYASVRVLNPCCDVQFPCELSHWGFKLTNNMAHTNWLAYSVSTPVL